MESVKDPKELIGKYFIDKYNLDGETSYTRVTHIYRVNDVKYTDTGNQWKGYPSRILCTEMSICYDEIKKTGEKSLIEAKISEIEVTPKDITTGTGVTTFNNMQETDTETWEKTAIELMSIVSVKSHVCTDMEHYCSDCRNNGTENCRFCCKRGEEKPTFYEKK